MEPTADPLLSRDQGGLRSGYQSIESGQAAGNTGIPVDSRPRFVDQVREAKQQSQGCCDFCLTFFSLLLGSFIYLIVVVITLTLPLVMIVLGSMYFHDCRIQPMIPIFNIVAGSVWMVSNVMNLSVRYRRFYEADTRIPRTVTAVGWITSILHIFLIAWFIAGCYWVYGAYRRPLEESECNLALYSFSFWLLNACFIFFFSMLLAAALMMCFAFICW